MIEVKGQDRIYTMTKNEFMILSALKDIAMVYGPETSVKMSEQDFVQILNQMLQKGMVENTGGQIVISPKYEFCFEIIKKADSFFEIISSDEMVPVSFGYIGKGEDIVIVSVLQACDAKIGMELCSKKDFYTYIEEMQYLPVEPEEDVENELDEEISKTHIINEQEEELSIQAEIKNIQNLTIIENIDLKTKEAKRIYIQRIGIKRIIQLRNQKIRKEYLYTRKNMKRIISQILFQMRGESDDIS